jgi:hypothetical protein
MLEPPPRYCEPFDVAQDKLREAIQPCNWIAAPLRGAQRWLIWKLAKLATQRVRRDPRETQGTYARVRVG